MTHQTATAHLFVLQQMEKIVEKDTGIPLRWHHLHASHIDDFPGILQWTADQHGGQAKGELSLKYAIQTMVVTYCIRAWSSSEIYYPTYAR